MGQSGSTRFRPRRRRAAYRERAARMVEASRARAVRAVAVRVAAARPQSQVLRLSRVPPSAAVSVLDAAATLAPKLLRYACANTSPMTLPFVIGSLSAACVAVNQVPQVARTLRTRNVRGLSLEANLIAVLGNVTGVVYGVMIGQVLVLFVMLAIVAAALWSQPQHRARAAMPVPVVHSAGWRLGRASWV